MIPINEKYLKILKVFISSPSDVYEEREALDEVIRDINNIWRDTLDIMLESKKWEINIPSKITNQNPNDIIINEIGKYDLYIGIMWSRFGSPTNGYESGTEQEFKIALNQFNENKNPLIKFYFSKRKFTIETENEVDQISKVKRFENEIKNIGIIKYYKTIDEFKYILFRELSNYIKDEYVKFNGD